MRLISVCYDVLFSDIFKSISRYVMNGLSQNSKCFHWLNDYLNKCVRVTSKKCLGHSESTWFL